MPLNQEEVTGLAASAKNAADSLAGFTEKAVLEIADVTDVKIKKQEAPKPTANKFSIGDIGSFNLDAVSSFASSLTGLTADKGFELYGDIKRYRFTVQFNPDELYINGYGGEELPIQKYRTDEDLENIKKKRNGQKVEQDPNHIRGGSTMAAANTRIEMSVKLVLDKSNPQDAFYYDKFNLNLTNVTQGVGRAIKTGIKGNYTSIQPEVEALTAIVRNEQRRLLRFIWGDMVYEGILNTVNAQYVMFNVNGEPCRAFVTLGMVLYDSETAGANTDIWQQEYQTDFYSMANPAAGLAPKISI
ncbi:CIS tube protein [Butyrivibrio sp. FCS014]|uniref:CIS tube protein n=1 Tax=Butyrivibrio sp. FCS014 TaxID=1408304 RepID=UPI000467DCE9|nr:hypothetical protein [Butyrivibrio sp. FCS014]